MIHDGLIRHAIVSFILPAREKIPLNFPPRGGGKKQGVEREQGEKGGMDATKEWTRRATVPATGTNCFNEQVGAAVPIKFHCERARKPAGSRASE